MGQFEEKRIRELTTTKYFHLQPKTFRYKEINNGRSKARFWNCLCDCGNIVERKESSIIQGLTESCGCMHPRNLKGKETSRYKGYEELSGQYLSVSRLSAKNRNIEWSEDLTPEYLWDIFIEQNKKCKLSGLDIKFETSRNKQKGMEQTASIDRIDSSKGYIKGNVQWLHKDVNKMKNNFTEERFFELCDLINKNNEGE